MGSRGTARCDGTRLAPALILWLLLVLLLISPAEPSGGHVTALTPQRAQSATLQCHAASRGVDIPLHAHVAIRLARALVRGAWFRSGAASELLALVPGSYVGCCSAVEWACVCWACPTGVSKAQERRAST